MALSGEEIIAHGSTRLRAQKAAKASRPKEKAEILFVPTPQKVKLPDIVASIQQRFSDKHKLYLVGGAVRDILLSRVSNDFDFVVEQEAIELGRKVADHLGGNFYVLDAERDAARVLVGSEGQPKIVLDFVSQKGASIDEDLQARDFSINALAIALDEENGLFDPCEGAKDLSEKALRACSAKAIQSDPIRILRAIRLAAQFGLKIEKATLAAIKEHVGMLEDCSAERIRDELMRILGLPKLKKSLQALDIIGALDIILPEVARLKEMEQSPPHRFDVWGHTLQTLESLEKILSLLDAHYPAEGARDLYGGLIVLSLGRYREQISGLLNQEIVDGRPRRSLLIMAALLHDAGKGITQEVGKERISYPGHEAAGAELAQSRLETLRFSRAEVHEMVQIIAAHKGPTELSREMDEPDDGTIFRYYQALGDIGIEVGLHSLADLMGRHGVELTDEVLNKRLAIIRPLFEAYFNDYERLIEPKLFIDGDDIMDLFGLEASPLIGDILSASKEAQATGKIASREEAIDFARDYLAREKRPNPNQQ